MNIIRTTGIKLIIHLRWPVKAGSPTLSGDIIERLIPYTTRYAQTLGTAVYAVGGTEDHLHVLIDLPPTRSIQEIHDELQSATMRFLRGSLNRPGFTWDSEDVYLGSISPDGLEELTEYIQDNVVRHATGNTVPVWEGEDVDDEDEPGDDEMPAWLRDILPDK